MRRFQDTPAFWRYFNARLKPFTRPLFLGSIGFLTLSAIAIYEYWQHPDWLQNRIEQPLEAVFGSRNRENIPQIAEEDLAVVADIDNIELLLQEMEQNQFDTSINRKFSNRKDNSSNTEFARFKKKQQDKIKNAGNSSSNYLSNNNALNDLLKPPSFTNYRSNLSTQTTKNSTSNPVGRLYLSNKNPGLNKTVSSPYIQNNSSYNLGEIPTTEIERNPYENSNNRRQSVNEIERDNNSNNLPNNSNQTLNNTANNTSNQPTNIDNSSNRFSTPSSSNTVVNSPGSENIQNNYNSLPPNRINRYSIPTPNYNRSVPNNYQLQPRNFAQQNSNNFNQTNFPNSNLSPNYIGTNNQTNNNNILSNSRQNQQSNNLYSPILTQPRQLNNQSTTNIPSNPTLQPAGSLSTSPLQ